MNPALTLAAPKAIANDPINKAGFFLLSLYFFFNYSRILDIIAPGLHLPLIIGLGLYGTAALAGSIQRAIATTAGKLLVALTGLMVLAGLFGAWMGGSAKELTDHWLKAFPFYFTVIGLCVTSDHIFRFLRTICIALTIMSLIALWRGDNMMGRLIIDNSRFADPNDLALVCLLGLPLCCFLLLRPQPVYKRLAGLLMMGPLIYALARTGSRGAAIGLAGGVVYVFWKASAIWKFAMIVGLAAVLLGAAAVLPPEVYMRYVGLVSKETPTDTQEMVAAEGSSEARFHLLQESVAITFLHPLLGVGPGNFAVAENDKAKEQGLFRGSWHTTHNMYTQVSSENGIPAVLLYIAILVLAMRATKRTLDVAKYHPDADSVAKAAFSIRVALLAFSIAGFFLSVAYSDMLPLLSGLAVALEIAVMNEIRMTAAKAPAPVVAPSYAGAGK
jgi:O-antigen ligase